MSRSLVAQMAFCLVVLAGGVAGCTSGGGMAPTGPSVLSEPVPRASTLPLSVLKARVEQGRRFFAKLVAGKVRARNGIEARLTNHNTFIGPFGAEVPLPQDFNNSVPPNLTQMPCPNPTQWNGDEPPTCDNSGPFRRVYYATSGGGSAENVVGSDSSETMPINGGNQIGADTGYIYWEGWPGAKTSNSEGGLIFYTNCPAPYCSVPYAAHYLAYLARPRASASFNYGHNFYNPGDIMQMFISPASSCVPYSPPCIAVSIIDITCGGIGHSNCFDSWALPDNEWEGANCCIYARMTTIAQNPPNDDIFDDGEAFGTVLWGQVYINGGAPPAGSIDWPNDTTKIIVNDVYPYGETDFIDLHS